MSRLELFDYELPEALIAQYPATQRDASRLLVVNRSDDSLADRQFSNLPDYLRAGDVLVLNNSRVIPARLLGVKREGGARIELFLLKRDAAVRDAAVRDAAVEPESSSRAGDGDAVRASDASEVWEVLARPARRLKTGDVVCFAEGLVAQVLERKEDGLFVVAFEHEGVFLEVLRRVGKVPLPSYIRRDGEALDARRYQTVYADAPGSAAAPTAGLHFTDELLAVLREKGVQTVFVTLHVGLGTFRPVRGEVIEEHRMHAECYHVASEAATAIEAAKREGRRVICVGTTSVRTVESAARTDVREGFAMSAGWGSTELFFYPGGRPFVAADALITNFHLPRSTLLMLVAAFYEREKLLAAYAHAIETGYRFFSYGDAMLIL
jgi:S-adenosylmethionine:tRNA ribosyltransferase-isomerase